MKLKDFKNISSSYDEREIIIIDQTTARGYGIESFLPGEETETQPAFIGLGLHTDVRIQEVPKEITQ